MTEPEERPPGAGPGPGPEPVGPHPTVPRISDGKARSWAVGCHLAGLAWILGVPLAEIIAPLVIWLLKRKDHPLIDANGKESLNFQISMTIYFVISLVLSMVGIGIVLLILILILNLVFPIIAAIRTSNGQDYRYPLTIRLVQ